MVLGTQGKKISKVKRAISQAGLITESFGSFQENKQQYFPIHFLFYMFLKIQIFLFLLGECPSFFLRWNIVPRNQSHIGDVFTHSQKQFLHFCKQLPHMSCSRDISNFCICFLLMSPVLWGFFFLQTVSQTSEKGKYGSTVYDGHIWEGYIRQALIKHEATLFLLSFYKPHMGGHTWTRHTIMWHITHFQSRLNGLPKSRKENHERAANRTDQIRIAQKAYKCKCNVQYIQIQRQLLLYKQKYSTWDHSGEDGDQGLSLEC